MKFMLMMNAPRGDGDWSVKNWTPEEVKAHMAFMKHFHEELKHEGVLAGAEGLAAPEHARLVRADRNGKPDTDGPFAESKEFLAGFWMVDVESAEQAYAIAARASLAPGPEGRPLYIPIEVRQVMSAPAAEP
jgi:hypothetical protein